MDTTKQDTVTMTIVPNHDEHKVMNKVTKILFYGTYPNRPIGYSKIANVITNYLACQPNIQVYYFGISNFDNQTLHRFVHPDIVMIDALQLSKTLRNSGEVYGVDVISQVMEDIQPDVFIIYNDCIVTCRLLNELLEYKRKYPGKTTFVSYLDLVYPYQKLRYITHIGQHVDRIFVFTPFWKRNLVDMGVDADKIDVFPHGIDTSVVYRMNVADARKQMGFGEDDFVVLNLNRNSYRKAHDVAIRAFLMFLKAVHVDPRVKMFISFNTQGALDYALEEVVATECTRLKLPYDTVVHRHMYSFPTEQRGSASDAMINTLYNACDVGLNTCLGEGFGLCNAEHASVDKMQVVSKVGGLQDIFEAFPDMLVQHVSIMTVPTLQDDHNGDAYICRAEDFAARLEHVYKNTRAAQDIAARAGEHVRRTYRWQPILTQFLTTLRKHIRKQ